MDGLGNDPEALVRREAARFFIRHFGATNPPSELIQLICEAVRDLDWETREIALEYWAGVSEAAGEDGDYKNYLEETWCATALTHAMSDREVRFKSRLVPVLEKVAQRIGFDKEKKEKTGDELGKVEPGTKLSFSEFLAALSRFEFVDPEMAVDEYCEVHGGLWSVVADINQSVREGNQLDGIDCV